MSKPDLVSLLIVTRKATGIVATMFRKFVYEGLNIAFIDINIRKNVKLSPVQSEMIQGGSKTETETISTSLLEVSYFTG